MHLQIVSLILCSIAVRTVTSINIEGPPITIYRPCGLSLLHFKKIDDKTWQGVLDFSDQNFEADISISFKERITSSLAAEHGTNNNTINIHVKLPANKRVTFDVSQNHSVLSVPFIAALTLNNDTICNDKIKRQFQGVCGRRSLEHEELMSLRTEAKAGDWPWAVAVYHYDSETYVGGGTILSHSVVITSAFILLNKTASTIYVIAGTSDLAADIQIGVKIVRATELIMHPGYRYGKYNTDNIGIIKVKKLTFSDYVQPVCIGEPHYSKTSSAIIVGFGNLVNHSKPGNKLRSIDTEIQTESVCKKTFTEYTELNLCGGYGTTSNLSPTRGDGGIGLVVSTTGDDQKTTWFLRGILIGCIVKNGDCDPSKYSVYANIGKYLGWINRHIVQ